MIEFQRIMPNYLNFFVNSVFILFQGTELKTLYFKLIFLFMFYHKFSSLYFYKIIKLWNFWTWIYEYKPYKLNKLWYKNSRRNKYGNKSNQKNKEYEIENVCKITILCHKDINETLKEISVFGSVGIWKLVRMSDAPRTKVPNITTYIQGSQRFETLLMYEYKK